MNTITFTTRARDARKDSHRYAIPITPVLARRRVSESYLRAGGQLGFIARREQIGGAGRAVSGVR